MNENEWKWIKWMKMNENECENQSVIINSKKNSKQGYTPPITQKGI